MIVVIDVHYRENEAKIVCLEIDNWIDNISSKTHIVYKYDVADYESGAFYKRELPCIINIMEFVDLEMVECIVVDSYVYLDDDGKKGLGYYVYEHFEGKIPVIGVAKTSFHNNTKNVRPILRGSSLSPLYVSSIGIDLDLAAQHVVSMAGEFRMPTLLKLLDTLTKEV
jgi:deoxyribonuclease V